MNDRSGPSTSRDHDATAIVSGTTSDSEDAAGTTDCTKCTKDGAGCSGGGGNGDDSGLPAPEPELFLLAGVTIASMRRDDARAVRARAELQAAIADASRITPAPSR